MSEQDDPARWLRTLRHTLSHYAIWMIDRVEILAETPSTQDAAFQLANGKPGLMLVAFRQTAGRGRLGRTWVQHTDQGVAITFVLDAARFTSDYLSLAAGVAAAQALDGLAPLCPRFGLRWPNDAVEPTPSPGGGRKIGGVLIEVREGLALVGIGLNVNQSAEDFPPDLRNRAVSLHQLGSDAPRLTVAEALLRELKFAFEEPARKLAAEWRRRDVLTGSTQAFMHDSRRISGIVESIDPTAEILLRTAPDTLVRLPALTTSLIHDG